MASSSLHPCSHFPFFFNKETNYWIRSHPNLVWHHLLTWLQSSTKLYVQIRSYSEIQSAHESWGDTIQPSAIAKPASFQLPLFSKSLKNSSIWRTSADKLIARKRTLKGRWHNPLKKTNSKTANSLMVSGLNYSHLWSQLSTDLSCKNTYPATSFGWSNLFSGPSSLHEGSSTQLSHCLHKDTQKKYQQCLGITLGILHTYHHHPHQRKKETKFTEIKQSAPSHTGELGSAHRYAWVQSYASFLMLECVHMHAHTMHMCIHTHAPSKMTFSFTLYLKHIALFIHKILELEETSNIT